MKIFTFESGDGRLASGLNSHLSRLLAKATPPISISVERADSGLAAVLMSWNGIDNLELRLVDHFQDTSNIRVLVSASDCERFRSYCLTKASQAKWGCCLIGLVAVEYAPAPAQLATQLHESLHLFKVDECYDEHSLEPKPECTNRKCLMRYGIISTEVCSSVIKQIQR
jgi:hypothetical protein